MPDSARSSLLFLACLLAPSLAFAQINIYQASSLYRMKKFEKLLLVLEDLEDEALAPPRLFLYKGDALASLERRNEAIDVYQDLIQRYPEHGDAFQARRKVLLLLEGDRNFPALIEAIQQYRKTDPKERLPYDRLEADAQFKAGNHDQAIALLASSDREADLRTLSEILSELKRVESFLEKNPPGTDDFASLRRRALLLDALARPSESAAMYQRALEKQPEDQFCLDRLAQAAAESGQATLAEATLRTLIRLFPEEVKYPSRLGKSLWRQGKGEAARQIWRDILEGKTPDAQRFKLVIRLFLDHRDPAGVLDILSKARQALKDRTLFREEEEAAHLMQKDIRKAVSVWIPLLRRGGVVGRTEVDAKERILELSSGSPKHFDEALAALEDARVLTPTNLEITLLLDTMLRQSGREEEVEPLLQDLIEKVGANPSRLRRYGQRFLEEERHLEASMLLSQAYRWMPPQARWSLSLDLARTLRLLGRAKEAQEILDPFFRDAPEDLPQALLVEAVDLRGRILLEDQGQNHSARQHFSAWIPRLKPGDPRAVAWVVLAARGAMGAGDFAAAEAAFEGLLERGGNRQHEASILFWYGVLHLYSGALEEGRQLLRKAAEDHPDSALANDGLAEVSFLLLHKEAGEEGIKTYYGLRHLVDFRRFSDYAAARGTLDIEALPTSLRDDALMLEARFAKAQGDLPRYRELLAKGAELDPEGPLRADFLEPLAELHEDANEFAQAERRWREFLEADPAQLRLDEIRLKLRSLARRRSQGEAKAPK